MMISSCLYKHLYNTSPSIAHHGEMNTIKVSRLYIRAQLCHLTILRRVAVSLWNDAASVWPLSECRRLLY